MTDSIAKKEQLEKTTVEGDLGGLPAIVQLSCLLLFVVVLYELLHPHLWLLVSRP